MKAVLMSIHPEWCDLIVRGKKTIEVRKTRPKLKTPFKVYIYCTKAHRNWLAIVPGHGWKRLDGKVIGEFTCDDIRRIGPERCIVKEDIESAIYGSCLNIGQVKKYAGWNTGVPYASMKDLYSWHISKPKIYDQPFSPQKLTACKNARFGVRPVEINSPPQSWRYVEELE